VFARINVVSGNQSVFVGHNDNTTFIENLFYQALLFLQALQQAHGDLAIDDKPVTFCLTVSDNEINQISGDSTLRHALVDVLSCVHGLNLRCLEGDVFL
jgi:hypothetical protein